MASSYSLLADLKAGRCSNTAEVRLLRFWEARNSKRGGELISLDMLFIDESSTLMQGSISAVRQLRFKQRLTEGSVYTLSEFDVTRSNPNYKLSDAPLAIRFNDGTLFEKLTNSARTIPTELFRFRPYNQLLKLGNTGKELPDIIGELCALRSTITDRVPGAQRVMLTLRVDRDVNVCVSMFDSLAVAFHRKLDNYGREPRVVLVTSVNPKIVGGTLFLNGTSATHIYFDSETAVGKDMFDRLLGSGTDQPGSSSTVVHSQKIEPMTVSELNQFVITADPQIIEFLCTAKVTEIQRDEGWCYIGCSNCSKKLIREETSFTCAPCNVTNAVAELRYRVVFTVSDATGTASFLGFDTEVAKLTAIAASEAAQIVGVGFDAQVDTDLPRSLAAIVGNTYTFQLRLTTFNFTANHKTFTISRLFPALELAPLPTFNEGVTVPEATLPGGGAGAIEAGSDATDASTVNVAEQGTSSETPLPGGLAAVDNQVDIDETVPKKARVE